MWLTTHRHMQLNWPDYLISLLIAIPLSLHVVTCLMLLLLYNRPS